MKPKQLIALQKRFFESGQSRDISFIKKKLKALKTAIINNEEAIYDAAYKDFKKPKFEVYGSEIGLLISQIDKILKNLHRWSKTKSVKASKLNFPSRDYIRREPFGSVLVISPWNYPFLLALSPAISAIAAGNTVVLKPSEMTPNTADLIKKILTETSLIVSIEASETSYWKKYTGVDGLNFGIDDFGKSAPYKEIYNHFNLNPESIIKKIKEKL